MTNKDPRPGLSRPGATGTTVAEWADTYTSARQWVEWNARRRWPDHPCNDDVWAMSVTSWWHG